MMAALFRNACILIIALVSLQINLSYAQNPGKNNHTSVLPQQASDRAREAVDRSDLSADRVVNRADLEMFSERYLQKPSDLVDWCEFFELVGNGSNAYRHSDYVNKHFGDLKKFTQLEFGCGIARPPPTPDALKLVHTPDFLARIVKSQNFTGDYYVSDPIVGSIFIYDSSLTLKQELKGLSRPLGIAIDINGYLVVGSDRNDRLEVYDLETGEFIRSFGDNLVLMPTDIAVDSDFNLYVVDSERHTVFVFSRDYQHIGNIGLFGYGQGYLNFPAGATIVPGIVNNIVTDEIYVADQNNEVIQVFTLDGQYQRSITPPSIPDCNPSEQPDHRCPRPTFSRLQGISSDSAGILHVVDILEAQVTMYDSQTGQYVGFYGDFGYTPGLLALPIDVVVNDNYQAIVTDGHSCRLEQYQVPY
jgi:hypothetical protein